MEKPIIKKISPNDKSEGLAAFAVTFLDDLQAAADTGNMEIFRFTLQRKAEELKEIRERLEAPLPS